jgi:CheY-like chemotaxis protein
VSPVSTRPSKPTLEAEVVSLLDALDAADEGNPKAKQRRKYERLKYRFGPVPADLVHPGGTATKASVHTRNLSAGGVCFLISGFVHPGTKCTIQLTNVMGRHVPVKGVVRWCTHVSGKTHQVGATFLAPIDPRQYVSSSTGRGQTGQGTTAQGTATGQVLPARVLYVSSEPLDRELMNMTMRNSPMRAECVDGPARALEAIGGELYDVVIMDLSGGEQAGIEFIRSVRAGGFRGPLVVLAVNVNSAGAKGAVQAGADEVVGKPYDAPSLLLRVSNQVRARNIPTGDAPIYSEIEGALSLSEPVQNYIDAARKKLADLDRALSENNAALATSVCEVLMATGTGFGFPIVTDCAALALWTVNETHSVAAARDELRRLGRVVGRLAVREPSDADAGAGGDAKDADGPKAS